MTALAAGPFRIDAVYPIKSEMSVGRLKLQAKSPIDIDIIIIVCRKGSADQATSRMPGSDLLQDAR